MAYLTPAEVRDRQPALADQAVFTDTALARFVDEFEEVAEDYLQVAYEPRTVVETLLPYSKDLAAPIDGTVRLSKVHPRSIVSVSVDGVTLASTNYVLTNDGLYFIAGIPSSVVVGPTVVVTYSHGFDAPPERLMAACAEYVRARAMQAKSKVPRDLSNQNSQAGASDYSRPNKAKGEPTGFKVVDALLNSSSRYVTGIA